MVTATAIRPTAVRRTRVATRSTAVVVKPAVWTMQRRPALMVVAQLQRASPIGPTATTKLPTGAKPIYKLRQPIAARAATLAMLPTEPQLALPVYAALPVRLASPIATALSPTVVKSILP